MHCMVLRSSAEHQPSSSRAIVLPPQSSIATNRSGTPVSAINKTSRRQQHASQLAQVTSVSEMGGYLTVIGSITQQQTRRAVHPGKTLPGQPTAATACQPRAPRRLPDYRTRLADGVPVTLGRRCSKDSEKKPSCPHFTGRGIILPRQVLIASSVRECRACAWIPDFVRCGFSAFKLTIC